MYSATTEAIRVTVNPIYVEAQSAPVENRYFWAYQVEIKNLGSEVVQLLNRHWKITDSLGRLQEVRGPGVVGEQPTLAPGEAFEYTSGTPLTTPSGIMLGTYEMQRRDGQRFLIDIPAFSLDSPHQPKQLN